MIQRYTFLIPVLLVIAGGLLWRIPLYINAEYLMWADEAANHLTLKHVFDYGELYFFYHGMRYQGLTEAFLSLVFVPFFGFSALSHKLAGTVVYGLFVLSGIRFIFQYTNSRVIKTLLLFLAITPPAHLYYASFMAYGGHLLNALLGFLCLYWIFHCHRKARMGSWQFVTVTVLIVLTGNYTYRHFIIFYPVIFLSVLAFPGGLKRTSVKFIVNVMVLLLSAILLPVLLQLFGEHLQGKTYETMNSFMSFKSFVLNSPEVMIQKFYFIFNTLWPIFFITDIQGKFSLMATLAGSAVFIFILFLGMANILDNSDHGKLLKVSLFHIAVVFLSVIITPYAIIPMDVRYLMPVYAVLPFIVGLCMFYYGTWKRTILSAGVLCVLVFMVNTVLFNNYRKTMDGIVPVKQNHMYSDVIEYAYQHKLKCIYMSYQDAYQVSLFSNENIWASAVHLPRIRMYEECARKEKPRVIILRNNNEEIPMFLYFKLKHVMKYRIRDKLEHFTVLESYTEN